MCFADYLRIYIYILEMPTCNIAVHFINCNVHKTLVFQEWIWHEDNSRNITSIYTKYPWKLRKYYQLNYCSGLQYYNKHFCLNVIMFLIIFILFIKILLRNYVNKYNKNIHNKINAKIKYKKYSK